MHDSTGARPIMTPGLALVFAITAGAAVGNLYWAQPLLEVTGRDLAMPAGAFGWMVTATQLGYVVGVFLIVPLGDVVDRRRLVPGMMVLSVLALLASAAAPSGGARSGSPASPCSGPR